MTSPDATTFEGETIAMQCCDYSLPEGEDVCRRDVDVLRSQGIGDGTGCVANHARDLESTTWYAAQRRCAVLGLSLCDGSSETDDGASCEGKWSVRT